MNFFIFLRSGVHPNSSTLGAKLRDSLHLNSWGAQAHINQKIGDRSIMPRGSHLGLH